MEMSETQAVVNCPECDAAVSFSKAPVVGRVVHCTQCASILVVINRRPLELVLQDGADEDVVGELMHYRQRRQAAQRRRRFTESSAEWRALARR